MFFSYNVLAVSRRIGRGQLDHTLVQPQPLWMALLTEGFMPFSGCWGAIVGLGISTWSLGRLDMAVETGWWLCYGVHLLSSCAVVLAFSYLWSALAFWSPVGAEEISSRAIGFALAVEVVSARWAASILGQRPVERTAGGFCRLVSVLGFARD